MSEEFRLPCRQLQNDSRNEERNNGVVLILNKTFYSRILIEQMAVNDKNSCNHNNLIIIMKPSRS